MPLRDITLGLSTVTLRLPNWVYQKGPCMSSFRRLLPSHSATCFTLVLEMDMSAAHLFANKRRLSTWARRIPSDRSIWSVGVGETAAKTDVACDENHEAHQRPKPTRLGLKPNR